MRMSNSVPQWQQIALYAVSGALIISLLFRVPYLGRALRALVSVGALSVCLFVLLQQAPYQPWLTPLLERSGLDRQAIVGDDVQLQMAPDGHFWARVELNGYETRMLVDTGATLTALSVETARRAGVAPTPGGVPIVARTANGVVQAYPASADTVRIGPLTATDLKVAVSPALGRVDVLGMNFLTRLETWRVEGRVMTLSPRPAAAPPRPARR